MRIRQLIVTTMLLASPSFARADCREPPAVLSWSHPKQDAVDVPTDADLVLSGRVVRVTRADSTIVAPVSPGALRYELGSLQANTDYLFHVTLRGSDPEGKSDAAIERTVTLRFRTTSQPSSAMAAPTPVITSHEVADPAALQQLAQVCPLLSETCPDTGEDRYLAFTPSGTAQPILWKVEIVRANQAASGEPPGLAFPGTCPTPWLLLHRGVDVCVRLHGLGADGQWSSSSTHCVGQAQSDAGPPVPSSQFDGADASGAAAGSPGRADANSDGCSVSATAGESKLGAWLLACAALAFARRRRASAAK